MAYTVRRRIPPEVARKVLQELRSSCFPTSSRRKRTSRRLCLRDHWLALAILSLRSIDTVCVVGALAHLLDQGAEPLVPAQLGKVWIQRLLATEQLVEVGLDVAVLARVRPHLEQPGQEVERALRAAHR